MITTVRIDKRIESEWLNSYQFPALVLYCGINLQFLKQCNVYFYNVEFQVLGRPIVFCCVFFCVCFYCITCLVSLPCCKRKLLSGGTDSGADWGIQLHSSLLSNTRCSIYRWGEGGGFQGSTGLVETGSPLTQLLSLLAGIPSSHSGDPRFMIRDRSGKSFYKNER